MCLVENDAEHKHTHASTTILSGFSTDMHNHNACCKHTMQALANNCPRLEYLDVRGASLLGDPAWRVLGEKCKRLQTVRGSGHVVERACNDRQ